MYYIIPVTSPAHLLPCKYMLIEVELQLLISHVNAQLLKRVLLEILKPKYVQNGDVVMSFTINSNR